MIRQIKFFITILISLVLITYLIWPLLHNNPGIYHKLTIRHPYILVVKDTAGNTIMDKDVSDLWNKPLRMWNYQEEILTHLHITKTGGTSLDNALLSSKLNDSCNLKCYLKDINAVKKTPKKCPGELSAFCGKHFDWSFVDKIEHSGLKTAPIVMLRNPVSRVISEYYFAQHVTGVHSGHKFLKQNISEFLTDLDSMMESNGLWHDGHGSAVWLTGIHIGTWWMTGWLPPEEILRREQLSTNWTYMLNVAIDNLHKCLWVGILEIADQSLEMLRFQTGLNITFQHWNKNNRIKPPPNEDQINMLKALLPIDMYMYEYAKQLHDHRWQIYLRQKEGHNTNVNTLELNIPNLPSTIDGCKSTRFYLNCPMLNINYTYTPSKASLDRTLRGKTL